MASDGSAFSLRLGFKDSPTVGDDFIDLNSQSFSLSNPTKGRGILLQTGGFAPGPIEVDPKWGQVQTLTMTVRIDGDSKDDCIGLLRTLNRFVQRSNFYFQDSGDNVSSRSDGRWHDGEAAVLTFQPADATFASYFDVIAGTPAPLPDLITLSTRTLDSISFSLKIRAGSRLTRVRLNNGVAMGDAAPPFNVSSAVYGGNFTAGYTFSGGAGAWQIIEDGISGLIAKYGVRTLTAQLSGASLTTNGFEVKSGDVIVPDIWAAFGTSLPTGGTFTAKLQAFISSVWTDVQTFASVSSFTGLASPSYTSPNWIRYSGTAYTVTTATQVRLSITAPTLTGSFAGAMGIDGLACWKNLVGNVVPLTEYVTGGKTAGIPAFNVYGLRGDVKVPIKMRFDNTSASQVERFFIVSGMTQDLGTPAKRTEYPVFGLDFGSLTSATTAAQLPWGTLPNNELTGAGTTASFSLDNNLTSRNLDRHQRLYRAFLWYAANDAITISAVKLIIPLNGNNLETKTYNTALPGTYTGNTTPTAAQYQPYDLGDFLFSRPGIGWEDNVQPINSGAFVTITHTSSANRHISVAGVIFLPQKVNSPMAATLDVGAAVATFPLAAEIYNEGKAPRGAIQVFPQSGNIPTELNSFDPTAILKGGNLWVLPAEASTPTMAMRFEVLMFRGRDATTKLFSFDARDTKQVSIEYTPRYLYGMAS
jgi:hypothetical protein